MKRFLRILALFSLLALALGLCFAQEHEAQPSQQPQASQPAQQSPENPGAAEVGKDLSTAATAGVEDGKKEEEEEENIGLKQSPMVKNFGAKLGLGPAASYWVFWSLNFAIVLALVIWVVKSKLVVAFRERTVLIRKSMDEASKASEAAMERLKAIETRLSRLDNEVAQLRSQAEAEFAGEEARIRQAANDDAKRVVEFAETEIAAAAKTARRDLKAFAAELAVALAEKNIKIDPQTDQHLVSTFVNDLGKDGK